MKGLHFANLLLCGYIVYVSDSKDAPENMNSCHLVSVCQFLSGSRFRSGVFWWMSLL